MKKGNCRFLTFKLGYVPVDCGKISKQRLSRSGEDGSPSRGVRGYVPVIPLSLRAE